MNWEASPEEGKETGEKGAGRAVKMRDVRKGKKGSFT